MLETRLAEPLPSQLKKHRMSLTATDFRNIKEKMNKIDQRIDGLYQNWQAEYKEAMTSEQCEDIQRFYEPYVRKYETKYKILYQTLRQAIDEGMEFHQPEFQHQS